MLIRNKLKIFFYHTIFSIIIFVSNALFSDTTRFVSYNLLNFEDENNRVADFISIIESIEPDIIIAQEVVSPTGFQNFLSDILDVYEPGQWQGATFTNQTASQDIALYYRQSVFTFISTSVVNTAQSSGTRNVIEWVMQHKRSENYFNVYGAHFKASSGQSNAQQRLQEATILRNHLNNIENDFFILAADLNIYSSSITSEPAFNMLIGEGADNKGQLFDPISTIGHWHNNSSYAHVHTQSPRTTNFGGGAPGGMDDRFDWLLVSSAILNESSDIRYVDGTYTAFGNDGNHFNQAINNGTNSAVGTELADALHNASDHLPVYMDVWFDDFANAQSGGVLITEIMSNPAAVSDSYGEWFEIFNATDSTIDINGWKIKDSDNDEHIISDDNEQIILNPESYFILARNSDSSINGGIDVNYQFSDFSLSNVEDEIIIQNLAGVIVDQIQYNSSWAFTDGSSIELIHEDLDNDDQENWLPSRNQLLSGDFGTPGGVNSTVKPKLEVNIQTECQGEVDIRSVDFGVVNAFDTSQCMYFITNTGYSDLILSNILITEGEDDNPSNYIGVNTDSLIIAPEITDTILVYFIPEEGRFYSGKISFETNDEYNPIFHEEIHGTGFSPTKEIHVQTDFESDTIYFQDAQVGDNSFFKSIYIFNLGNTPLQIDNIISTEPFFVGIITNGLIDPMGNLEVPVQFYPDSTGIYNGTLTIFSNDSDEEQIILQLYGYTGSLGVNQVHSLENITLYQNHPNPFNPITIIRYDVPKGLFVKIAIYDMIGRKVSTLVNSYEQPGLKSIQWNGTDDFGRPVSAGLYLYEIKAGGFRNVKKMVIIK